VASLVLATAVCCRGQSAPPIPQPDSANLTGLTTPIEVQFKDRRLQASGFFYIELAPETEKKEGPHWTAITNVYVVTAKHVIQPKRLKDIVKFSYALRVASKEGVAWHPLELDSKELGRRLHLCKNESVDVAVVEVTDQLNAETKKLLEQRAQLLSFSGASSNKFPGSLPLEAQPGDDVIVIGYPLGIYDVFNKLPILKTGLLNTPIGMRFNGLDAFLFDFKYYEGSSGSLIITRPTHLGVNKEGILVSSTSREYLFLGMYEGEYYWNNDAEPLRAELGLGWYYYTVEEAIKNPPFAP
jgi:hypothetical protein